MALEDWDLNHLEAVVMKKFKPPLKPSEDLDPESQDAAPGMTKYLHRSD